MLQTDLHNPQVTDKMKITEFLKLARSIEAGGEKPLSQTYLEDLYEGI